MKTKDFIEMQTNKQKFITRQESQIIDLIKSQDFAKELGPGEEQDVVVISNGYDTVLMTGHYYTACDEYEEACFRAGAITATKNTAVVFLE